MDTRQMQQVRERLIARKGELQRDIVQLDEQIVELGVDQEQERGSLGNHLADDGSSLGEQQVISTLEGDFQVMVDEIDAALKRLDDGTYGVCQRCGRPVGAERLEALPHVAFCIECQSFLERQMNLFGARVAT